MMNNRVNEIILRFFRTNPLKKPNALSPCAKAVLSISKIFLEYKKTWQFCFARYFFNWTSTPKQIISYFRNVTQRTSVQVQSECCNGYIAIVTVLVIGAVMISVGMAVVLNSINTGQGSLSEIKKESGIGYIESCVEDALMRINADNALAGTITLPEGTCTVTINSQVGSAWDFTVSGTLDGYSKSIRVTATRGTNVTVNSWIEI